MARIVASPADVRSFAAENGIAVSPRGALPLALIETFNAGQRTHTYTTGIKPVKAFRATAMRTLDSGRRVPITKNISTEAVRAAAAAAGVSLGRRGKVSSAAVQATLTGDWSAFLTPTAGDLAAEMVE